jgi:hypothetical protein
MATTATTEADILEEIINPRESGLSPDAAKSLLQLAFSKGATKRIRQLLQKNNKGTISAGERITLDRYLRVGQFLDLIQAKARLSLRASGDGQ